MRNGRGAGKSGDGERVRVRVRERSESEREREEGERTSQELIRTGLLELGRCTQSCYLWHHHSLAQVTLLCQRYD